MSIKFESNISIINLLDNILFSIKKRKIISTNNNSSTYNIYIKEEEYQELIQYLDKNKSDWLFYIQNLIFNNYAINNSISI